MPRIATFVFALLALTGCPDLGGEPAPSAEEARCDGRLVRNTSLQPEAFALSLVCNGDEPLYVSDLLPATCRSTGLPQLMSWVGETWSVASLQLGSCTEDGQPLWRVVGPDGENVAAGYGCCGE